MGKTFNHPGTKGDADENVWISLLDTYQSKRYQAAKAHVVDSNGAFSQQIDVVVFDPQYSPFIFTYEDQTIMPAESVSHRRPRLALPDRRGEEDQLVPAGRSSLSAISLP